MSDENTAEATLEVLIAEVWNKGHFERIPDVFAANAELHMAGNDLTGPDAIRDGYIKPFRMGFSDLHIDVLDLFRDGDKFAMRVRGTGTHDGEYRGKPATGKKLDYDGVVLFHMEGGKIAHVWGHSNAAAKFDEF